MRRVWRARVRGMRAMHIQGGGLRRSGCVIIVIEEGGENKIRRCGQVVGGEDGRAVVDGVLLKERDHVTQIELASMRCHPLT